MGLGTIRVSGIHWGGLGMCPPWIRGGAVCTENYFSQNVFQGIMFVLVSF